MTQVRHLGNMQSSTGKQTSQAYVRLFARARLQHALKLHWTRRILARHTRCWKIQQRSTLTQIFLQVNGGLVLQVQLCGSYMAGASQSGLHAVHGTLALQIGWQACPTEG